MQGLAFWLLLGNAKSDSPLGEMKRWRANHEQKSIHRHPLPGPLPSRERGLVCASRGLRAGSPTSSGITAVTRENDSGVLRVNYRGWMTAWSGSNAGWKRCANAEQASSSRSGDPVRETTRSAIIRSW